MERPTMPLVIDSAGASHGSLKTYLTGFILSIILTVVPFALVMSGGVSRETVVWTIVAFAVVQIVVHLVCFLHMNTSSEEGWNFYAIIFALIVIVILVGGSLWIMHHLNANMMPH